MQLSVITASNVVYCEQLDGEMALKRCILNVYVYVIMYVCVLKESMTYNFCVRIYNPVFLESRFKLQFSANAKLKKQIDDCMRFKYYGVILS